MISMLNTHKSKFYMISSRITIKKVTINPINPINISVNEKKSFRIKIEF
jgi:hypothetical protein